MNSKPFLILIRLCACSTLALAAVAAHADPYQFTLSNSAGTASWQLDSSPVPDEFEINELFIMSNVPLDLGGFVLNADLGFRHLNLGGGLAFREHGAAGGAILTGGIQLYTGTEAAPTFKTGSFILADPNGTDNYTLNISAVPEPTLSAMLLAGLGIVGIAAARRQRENA
jgi:hypothetical protein